jgi:hypothetical protein
MERTCAELDSMESRLDTDEVEVVNRLLPRGTVTLLSKPPKNEWLVDLFKRYGDKKRT